MTQLQTSLLDDLLPDVPDSDDPFAALPDVPTQGDSPLTFFRFMRDVAIPQVVARPPKPIGPIRDEFVRGHHLARQVHHMLAVISPDVDLADLADDIAITRRKMREIPTSPELRAFQEKGVLPAIGTAIANPLDVALPLIAGSMSAFGETGLVTSALGAGAGAAAGALAGPPGAAVGARIGMSLGVGAGSLLLEASSEFFDEIEEGIRSRDEDIDDPAAWRAALSDPKAVAAARSKALRKGVPIATIDALSAGIAGRLLAPVKGPVKKALTATGEVAIQGALGGTGEALGQLAAEGRITDPAGIAAEIVAEFGPGSVEVAAGTAIETARQSPSQRPAEAPTATETQGAAQEAARRTRPQPQRWTAEAILTEGGARELAEAMPQKARELADKTTPSRADVQPILEPGETMSGRQRRDLADTLRAEVLPATEKRPEVTTEPAQTPENFIGTSARAMQRAMEAEGRTDPFSVREIQSRTGATGPQARRIGRELRQLLGQEVTNAPEVQGNQAQPEARQPVDVAQGGEDSGRENLQRQPQEGREAGRTPQEVAELHRTGRRAQTPAGDTPKPAATAAIVETGVSGRGKPGPAQPPPQAPPPDRVALASDGFDLPTESKYEVFKRRLVDRFRPIQRAQEVVVSQGGALTDESNAFLGQELFQGKVEGMIRGAEQKHVTPIIRLMTKAGLTVDQVGEYLYAKFAPARNARIAEINPELEGPGSGMSDQEAAQIIEKHRGKRRALESIARRVYRMNDETRAMLVEGGNISQAQSDSWRQTQGEFYVPLRTDVEGEGARTGRGFDIRGKEAHTATGRRSRADNPLVYSLLQHQIAIVRSEKNKVGQRLLKFVRENPSDNVWTVDETPQKPVLDKGTGLVRFMPDPLHRMADNVVSVKVDGDQHLITFRGNAAQMATAFKNMGTENAGILVRALSPIMRFFSAINTSVNPEFILTNFARDVQTAGINITSEQRTALAGRVIRNTFKAMRGAWRGIRNVERDDPWTQYFHEFVASGGKVGWFHVPTLEERAGELAGMLKDANPSNPRKVLMGMREVARLVQDVNSAVENAVRLSAFVEFQKEGLTKEQAASAAKNLTVNFNRRGEAGQLINSLYLFSNASIQGTARFLKASATTARGRKLASGMIAASFFWALMNRWIAGEDEDGRNRYDKIPPWVKERNLIIMLPGTKKHVTIPLPYGYSIMHALGQQTADTIFGDQTPVEGAANVWSALMGSFNPVGSESSIVQQLSPTLLDPVVQLATNETFYGSPITPEQAPYGPPKPRSELYWDGTSPSAIGLSRALNRFTGGTDVEPGLVDVSPTWFQFVTEFLTGGTGRTAVRAQDTVTSIMRGEELPLQRIPFLRRFLGEPSKFAVSQDFYKIQGELDILRSRIANYRKTDRGSRADRLIDANRDIMNRMNRLVEMEKNVRKINRAIRQIDDERTLEVLTDRRDTIQRQHNAMYRSAKQ